MPVWQASPETWISEVLSGWAPWSRQLDILRAIATHDEVNVATGHGVGKTALVARITLWYLLTRTDSIVLTTAPTEKQVETILWGEIRGAYAKSKIPLGGELLPRDSMLRFSEKHYAKGIVARDASSLQGFHAPHVLVIIDEAAGVPAWAEEALLGCAVTSTSKIIRIGNPTCGPTHPFAKAFNDTGPRTKCIRIASTETPNYVENREVIPGLMTRQGVARIAKKFGVGSDQYKARVLGQFPSGSSDSLITQEHIEAARERWKAPQLPRLKDDPPPVIRLGVDVARFGDDLTCIVLLEGNRARVVSTLAKADGPMVARRIGELAKQYGAVSVAIDGGGLGGGAVDALVELQRRGEVPQNLQVYDVDFGSGATDKTEHANKRCELWYRLKEWLWQDGAVDPDPETEEELLATTYKWGKGSAAVLEPKERIKARLGRSPDRADAFALAVAGHVGKVQQRGPLVIYGW